MESALESLRKSSSRALERTEAAYALQNLILTKAGQCVSKIHSFDPNPSPNESDEDSPTRPLFSKNREILKRILAFNEETIRDYQEHRLDQLDDPMAFFASPAWQQPQQLISLASYWLGWNGYYASLHFPKNDPQQRELLQEAIDGFSRAFIDFEEDAVTTKSLFGRGLCYKQLELFGRAAHDFQSIRDKLPKKDPLTVRCRYEEAAISFDTRNIERAQRELNQIREDYPQSQIPEDVALRMNRLEANLLLARAEKTHRKDAENSAAHNDPIKTTFTELRRFASEKEGATTALYQFTKKNAEAFEAMRDIDLWPVGTLAIADWHFEHTRYDQAKPYYLDLYTKKPVDISRRMDSIAFRLAVIFAKKQDWARAIATLESFSKQFPKSSISADASALFYLAAGSNYHDHANNKAYQTYLASIRQYLNLCTRCPERDNAHFELGSYYQKRGQIEDAISEFKQVGQASPRYPLASYQLIFLETRSKNFDPGTNCASSLKQLDHFERRYPKGFDRKGEASSLRVWCNVQLGNTSAAKGRIDAFALRAANDRNLFAALRKLGDRLYQVSHNAGSDVGASTAGVESEFALSIYEHLFLLAQKEARFSDFANPIQLRIAQLYADEGRIDSAIGTYRSVLQRDPQSADAVFGLGLLYARAERWQQALETWRTFSDGVKSGTHHWFVSRYQTANALQHLGESERACTVARMTLVLHPDVSDEDLLEKFQEIRSMNCSEETTP